LLNVRTLNDAFLTKGETGGCGARGPRPKPLFHYPITQIHTDKLTMHTLAFLESLFGIGGALLVLILIGVAFSVLTCFRKVEQGRAIVRTGLRGTNVSFAGLTVFPSSIAPSTWTFRSSAWRLIARARTA
jgi:hypothetical protein